MDRIVLDSAASGLFDNLSLASQLEGFASAQEAVTSNLKDLLKSTTNNGAGSVPVTSADDPAVPSNFGWSGESSVATGAGSNYPWNEYSWNPSSWNNNSWNNAWAQSDYGAGAAGAQEAAAFGGAQAAASGRQFSSAVMLMFLLNTFTTSFYEEKKLIIHASVY